MPEAHEDANRFQHLMPGRKYEKIGRKSRASEA
jgi:hypothetical protein